MALLNSHGVGWLGGNLPLSIPIIKYVVKITHKTLLLGSYSAYQTELSDKIIQLRDVEGLTYKAVADLLIKEGYRSPRGLDLGSESVFSIYKKRKIRDARLKGDPEVKISNVEIIKVKSDEMTPRDPLKNYGDS